MTTKKAKELVREYESAKNGIDRLADMDVCVVNVRVRKETIIADVTIMDYSDKTSERHDDCEYPIEELVNFNKTRVLA